MTPDRQTVLEFWEERSDLVDRAIARGCRAHSEEIEDWSTYEWAQSLQDLANLSGGRDAFYDRPTIGVAYGLWYHARRVNPLVSEVERIVRQEADKGFQALTIVDLGSGTGATSWAAALVTWAIRQAGGIPPMVNVHEVESSTFMRRTSTALWDALGQELGLVEDVSRRQWSVSWPEMSLDADEPTWLIASYLLDHTDRHRREEITKSLCRVVDNCGADGVIFTVSQNKRHIAKEVIDDLETDHDWISVNRRGRTLWSGDLDETADARREIYSRQDLGQDPLLAKTPSFHIDTPSVLQATRGFGDETRLLPFRSSSRWFSLNDEQEEAASPGNRSVLLKGAAGSGKSVVLVEVLARLIERSPIGQPRSVLVTSFNKYMVQLLAGWFTDRMNSVGIRSFNRTNDTSSCIKFSGVGTGSDQVTFCNWDQAPTRLAGLTLDSHVTHDSVWLREAGSITEELLATNPDFRPLGSDNYAADPEFQLMELRRVVYGLMATTKDKYLEVERTGRIRAIGVRQRELVWSVIERAPQSTFTHRRIRLLEEATTGHINGEFTDLFVDEAQDFLPADIECCYALREGNNPVFMVVDQAQALHTGSSYQTPGSPAGANWLSIELFGSYRLPVAIANCVRPLAESIQQTHEEEGISTADIAIPHSRKASVVGVRPIVVVGDEAELARSIHEIRFAYNGYLSAESESNQITICEPDLPLARAIGGLGDHATPTTVKKIKGLERGFVVWSTRTNLGNADESAESVYTIATRSSCILVIAVDPEETSNLSREILDKLDQEHLMFWNQESETWWDRAFSPF